MYELGPHSQRPLRMAPWALGRRFKRLVSLRLAMLLLLPVWCGSSGSSRGGGGGASSCWWWGCGGGDCFRG